MSAEREVSLNSGNAVHQALLEAGVDAHTLSTCRTTCAFHQICRASWSTAFSMLHGRGGEDGSLRVRCSISSALPYTGSGNVCASALTMDKMLDQEGNAAERHCRRLRFYTRCYSDADCDRLLASSSACRCSSSRRWKVPVSA